MNNKNETLKESKTSPWLDWAVKLQAIAQAGLTYGKDVYDRERYEQIRDIATEMTGNILDVKVKVGDTVKAGTVLCVLEAMKMENEIPAPKDGKVAQVVVTKGATVGAGDTLVVLA